MSSLHGRFHVGIMCMLFLAVGVTAGVVDAQAPSLDHKARKAIATFGDGVIRPVQSTGLLKTGVVDPLSYAGLNPGTSVWKIIDGDKKGKTLNRTVQPHAAKKFKHVVVTEGFHTAIFEIDKGSIFRTTQVSVEHSTVTTFTPFEPVLIDKRGMGPPLKQSLAISVHSIEQPTVVTHTGTLESEYEVLGTFDVHVPAGHFTAIGVRVTYKGSVGPASISDESYVFFTKGVGPVAIRGRSHISAFLIYNESRNVSMILESLPAPTDVAEPVGPTD